MGIVENPHSRKDVHTPGGGLHEVGFEAPASTPARPNCLIGAHFDSRQAMLAEAADRAGAESVAAMERTASAAKTRRALRSLLTAYLSKAHVEGIETGCAVAALGSEMPRQTPEVRHALTHRIKEMIDLVARQSPDWGKRGAHERALFTVAAMVGSLVLARAVNDERLSDELREATLKHLARSSD